MNFLKKLFPYSFEPKRTPGDLAKRILFYLGYGTLAGAFLVILCMIPLVGLIFDFILGVLIEYILLGIILTVVDYLSEAQH